MHWNDYEMIASQLEEYYPDEEIPEHDLSYLKEMVLSLANFEDLEVEPSHTILKQIIESWIEIRDEL